jgi:hypothetical protein
VISQEDAVTWARAESRRLREHAGRQDPTTAAPHVRTLAAPAMDLLHRQAPGTEFDTAARYLFETTYVQSAHRALNLLASLLDDCAVTSKRASPTPPAQRRVRAWKHRPI